MESSKVKLPKTVAEAIEYFLNGTQLDFPIQAIMKVAMDNVRYIGNSDYCNVIKDYVKSVDNLMSLMQALVNGYEVEERKEDKVRKVIQEYCNGRIVSNWVVDAIKEIYEGAVTHE